MSARYAALMLTSMAVIAASGAAAAQSVVPNFVTSPGNAGYALAIDAAQNLYVSENNLANIYKFPASGTGTVTGGSTASLAPLITGTSANAIWIDGAGNIYISALGPTVTEFPPAGGAAPGTVIATVPGAAAAIAFDHTGNLYVADNVSGEVYKFLSTNTCRVVAPCVSSSADANFAVSTPSEMAIDGDGNVYVTSNDQAANVTQISSGGANTTFITGLPGSPTGGVTGISIDPANNIYVTDFSSGEVVKFASVGGVAAGGTPASANYSVVTTTGLTAPVQSAFDRHGELYVGNAGDGSVTQILLVPLVTGPVPTLSVLGLIGMASVLLATAWSKFRGRKSAEG
jgi:sugar lactone lactonase YvrE